jgi:trk system potassium uptake protein TrkH
MKIRVVLHTLGLLAILLGVLMLLPGLIAAIYKEPLSVVAFAIASLSTILAGLVMKRAGRNGGMDHREAFASVSLGWLLATFFGSLPFIFLGMPVLDSLFESMSGFTTTGATILTEYNSQGYWVLGPEMVEGSLAYIVVESASSYLIASTFSDAIIDLFYGISLNLTSLLSIKGTFYGLLFWRSFSQLLGGMGIILLFIAILPNLGVAGRQLYQVEGLGLTKEAFTPRVKNTAKTFWGMYLGLVVIEAIILLVVGLPFYDSICTSFTSMATGGFSPKAYSIAAYNSVLVECVVCIFLIMGGMSFPLLYRIIYRRDLERLVKDPELRFYLLIMLLSFFVIIIWGRVPGDLMSQIRFASFQIISTITTTGFVNNFNYDAWSLAAKIMLIILMLIGGCAGSTAGGIKVGRVLITLKYTYNELIHALHPRAVMPMRLGNTIIREEVVHSVLLFMLLYLMIFIVASLAFAITEMDNPQFNAISAISASACCLGVVGPGFGVVALDFSGVSQAGRLLGIVCMYLGRLEIIPAIMLLLPELWKK